MPNIFYSLLWKLTNDAPEENDNGRVVSKLLASEQRSDVRHVGLEVLKSDGSESLGNVERREDDTLDRSGEAFRTRGSGLFLLGLIDRLTRETTQHGDGELLRGELLAITAGNLLHDRNSLGIATLSDEVLGRLG